MHVVLVNIYGYYRLLILIHMINEYIVATELTLTIDACTIDHGAAQNAPLDHWV